MMKLEVVTASVDEEASKGFWQTWSDNAVGTVGVTHVLNKEPRGVVPAFASGIIAALREKPDIIACLHDDVAIYRDGWNEVVTHFFETHPKCGLLGFGGATGIGRPGMYDEEYDPMSLARHNFMSNMKHAEAHGTRTCSPRKVAVLDGFSQIGRTEFMVPAWEKLIEMGIIHHAYDAALGCLAKRMGWETWLLPLSCHHHGGLTAVANPDYLEWAFTKDERGDGGFWETAHKAVYEEFRDVLPFHVELEEE